MIFPETFPDTDPPKIIFDEPFPKHININKTKEFRNYEYGYICFDPLNDPNKW